MDNNKFVNIISNLIIFSIYIFAIGIFTSKFLLYLGMALSLVFWITKLIIKNKKYRFENNRIILPFFIFILSILLSGIGSWHKDIIDNKFIYSFIFFIIVINEIKEKKDLVLIMKFLLLSIIVMNFYGFYQYMFIGLNRVSGFGTSLSFGLFQAIIVIFILIYIFWGKIELKYKISLLFLGFISFMNLIFSQTRGAWLSFIIVLFILGIYKSKKIFIFIIISTLLLLIILPNPYINRFMSSFNLEYNLKTNRSNSIRLSLWKTAIEMYKDHPVNGVGLDNFKKYYVDGYAVKGIRPFDHTHNNLLNFAAELGTLGLVSFIYLMFIVFKQIYLNYKKEEKINIKLFYFASLMTFLIYQLHGLTEYNLGDTESLHFFWFLIAVNVSVHRSNFTSEKQVFQKGDF